jgi:2-polyprenyl-3-methyl-5-hydroxy-6-metoxy-1,4-benzoquinol methylase
MPNLKQRSTKPEKMDDPSAPEGEVRKALAELETINRWLGGYKVILHALEHIKWPREIVTIMDVGSGGGDTLRVISDWATKKQRRVKLIGVDINPAMTRYAGNKSLRYPDIHFRTTNVFDDALLLESPHIVTCNLFAHHFDEDNLLALLRRMHQLASNVVIINDLDRHPVAYHSIRLLSNTFSKTYLVKYDGPLSVARSLTRKEWVAALEAAGIRRYSIRWRWAWRWEIIIMK